MPKSWSQRFDVEPMPTPRLRFRRIGKGVATYYKKEYPEYMQRVEDAYAGPHFGNDPLTVEILYSIPRPKSHYGTGKNASVLKDSAPPYPTTKPDVDNYEKAILDGLSGVAYTDDRQVCDVHHKKRWGDPFVHVSIQLLEE